jgi:hypothetical protein
MSDCAKFYLVKTRVLEPKKPSLGGRQEKSVITHTQVAQEDQFAVECSSDPYHQIFQAFEGSGCGSRYRLIIDEVKEVSREFYERNRAHFTIPAWYDHTQIVADDNDY